MRRLGSFVCLAVAAVFPANAFISPVNGTNYPPTHTSRPSPTPEITPTPYTLSSLAIQPTPSTSAIQPTPPTSATSPTPPPPPTHFHQLLFA